MVAGVVPFELLLARSREAGFADHLIKPVNFEVLKTRIAAIAV